MVTEKRKRRKLDRDKVEEEVVSAAVNLARENPDTGFIVMEETDFPPFSNTIQQKLNLPVFDSITLTNMVYQAVVGKGYDTGSCPMSGHGRTNCSDMLLNSYDADSDSRNSLLRWMLKREYIDHEGIRRRS